MAELRVPACGVLAAVVVFTAFARNPAPHAEQKALEPDRSDPPRPNIVLVSIDSLRYDHLGCYGYAKETSPTIDRIAREGVRFENAVSTTSWTLPAHAAMFTGLYDSAHGVVDAGMRLDPDHVTLAELFQAAGWHTAGFFGGPFLHPTFGLDQGFDAWRNCMTAMPADLSDEKVRESLIAGHDPSHKDVTGPRTLAEIERWLAASEKRQPFFLFLHLWDVHYDYIPPKEYVEKFDPGYAGSLDASNLEENPALVHTMPKRDLEHLLALYDGEIRFTDDMLGKILEALEHEEKLANTIVIVTADHGEEFFEHGGKGHQATLYDEVVRVPLIVRWPGHLPAGRVVGDQVRLIDVMPTLLALASVEKKPILQGRDLGPLLRGEALEPAPALCELLVPQFDLRALRTAKTKVIDSRRRTLTLGFDLADDPGERRPVLSSATWVRAGRDAIAKEVEAARAIRVRIGAEATKANVSDELRERLKRLGYTGADEHEDKDER